MSVLRIQLTALLLLAIANVHAEMSVEFDPDRVEAGKAFSLNLVVPLRELPELRNGAPVLQDLGEFTLSRTDSIDDVQTDFFMRSQKVRKYRFHLLAPRKEGRYTLRPQWELGGTLRNLGSVNVQVQRPYDAAALTATLTPSKRTVYEGEQLTLALTLLTYPGWQGKATPLSSDLGNDFTIHRSDMKDFQFVRSQSPGAEMEARGQYAWIAPLRNGELVIPALKFGYTKVGAPKVVEKKTGNFSFRSVTQEPEEATTSSAPVRITVKALPASGRPAHFNGMVGQYTFRGTLDKEQLQVGEAATLTLTLRGNGKPGMIADPPLPSFSEFRTVPPEVKVTRTQQGGQIITEKSIRIFLYPKKAGTFEIPSIGFAWFDPAKKSYQTAETPVWTLQVEKGELTEMAASGGGPGWTQTAVQSREIEQLGSDIRHIASTVGEQNTTPLHRSFLYWVLIILPFALSAIITLIYRIRAHRLSDAVLQRRSHAGKALRQRLAEAGNALASGDSRQFYAALGNGLEAYLSDLYNKEFRGMTRDTLQLTLQELRVSEADRSAIGKLLSDCDFARFAPVGVDRTRMEEQLKTVESLLKSLEVLA